MKKFLVFILSLLGLCLLAFGIFFFMIFRPISTVGPKTYYRVYDGAVQVFALKDGEVRSLLAFLKPGETLMAPTVSDASLEVPPWLSWIEPVVVDFVGRARYFMYKEGKKAKYNEFTVGYTNKTIRGGFIRELERTGVLKNVELSFLPDQCSFFAQVLGVSITARGIVTVPEGDRDRLLLHLYWLKIGSASMPERVLRAVENLFASTYEQSPKYKIRLLKITFKDKAMVMSFKKAMDGDTGVSE
ncbi:MAG: hypothetical protein A2351_07740 [Omnitrophica bacterium RIFOXYB12_FULL_50_7]|nr:MAG: hypothetical protein A2351_07740 [Omnitrophica bacterium RIFOXYB12_FULL_50_7]